MAYLDDLNPFQPWLPLRIPLRIDPGWLSADLSPDFIFIVSINIDSNTGK